MTIEGVNVLILDILNNKVLCVLRSEDDSVFPGMWALPGGAIEKGETHKQAALRELKEEINGELSFFAKNSILQTVVVLQGITLHVYVYLGVLVQDVSLMSNTSDIADVQWIPPKQLLDSIIKFHYPLEEVKSLQDYFINQGMSV